MLALLLLPLLLLHDRANDVRDALNKSLYGKLFGWIVQHINTVLAPSSGTGMMFVDASDQDNKGNEIGILDIFGFENFVQNGFEQMCINVTNEQLQNFFNKHIFENELNEYRKEGVDATNINFVDNGPLLEMFFSKRPPGMFALLDEESHFPRATDLTLVAKYTHNLKGKEYYVPKRTDDDVFSLKHYAGTVEYTSTGFLEKNRDTLAPALVKSCQESQNSLIRDIFSGSVSATGAMVSAARQKGPGTSTKKSPTVGAQFTASLNVLIEKLLVCSAHFIRCIKPNTKQQANNYVPDFVNIQLSYTGMLETCRIRREGYSYRPSFDMFMERFGLLAYGPAQNIHASRDTCEKVLQVSQLQKWLIGRTKVFLKYWHVEQLDKQLRRFDNAAVTVQKWVRRLLAQKYASSSHPRSLSHTSLYFGVDGYSVVDGVRHDLWETRPVASGVLISMFDSLALALVPAKPAPAADRQVEGRDPCRICVRAECFRPVQR